MNDETKWKLGEPTPTLNSALAKAQGVMEPARKESENPAFKRDGKPSRYADFSAIVDACRKPLTDNGLSFVQICRNDKDGITVTTILLHSSGEQIESPFWVPVGALTAQEYGKASTYGRRFGLQALLGIPADDDDGTTAVSKPVEIATPEVKSEPIPKAWLDAWVGDLAKFAALGKSTNDVHYYLGRDVGAGVPKTEEWAKVRQWMKELKQASIKADVPGDIDEAARAEVRKQAEDYEALKKKNDAAIAADSPVDPAMVARNAAFNKFRADIDAAATSEAVTMLTSAASAAKLDPKDLKVLLQRGMGRIKELKEPKKKAGNEDVPF